LRPLVRKRIKKIAFTQLLLLAVVLSGCGGESANNTSANANKTNAARPANTAINVPYDRVRTGNTTLADSNVAATNATRPIPKEAPKPVISPGTVPTAPPPVEKKDEGLFSFPPPKVIDYGIVPRAELVNEGEETRFSQISDRLGEALRRAGYDEKYSYFWNDKEEFAIVTAMERVSEDGSPLAGNERWADNDLLPRAHGPGDYIRYLISGKKTYYRVMAFVVTSRRSAGSFLRGNSPEFTTALGWKNTGEAELGDGGPPTIEDVVFGENFKCFALLYLFVNHTSLDRPKSLDKLVENELDLKEGMETSVENHLERTGILFR
jgi:hypothetical protein